jgi:nicotinate-nucleotide--dimethylbenzimidazole phosphoribosyltransferase
VIARALDLHGEQLTTPTSILSYLGGFEIAALVGAYIRCAQMGIPILVDGYISSAAALLACQLNPSIRNWMLFAHRSQEPGHEYVLAALKASPLLDLQLRLGEGSGAGVALPLVKMALALHQSMATFEQAQVSNT